MKIKNKFFLINIYIIFININLNNGILIRKIIKNKI